jgi:autotransporter translocation and assembly factor TamB
VRRDDVRASASGTVTLSGSPDDLLVTGRLTTDSAELRLAQSLPPTVVKLDVIEVGGPGRPEARAIAEAAKSPPSVVRLDVDVSVPRRLFLRGRGLDSEWAGDLKVAGTADAPTVKGALHVLRGTFSFAGKELGLSSGSVDFEPGEDGKPAARLDVKADFSGADFRATLRLHGPIAKPAVELTSTPDMPPDEIVSRILYNRGTGKLSAVEALQVAQTVTSLTGGGSSVDVLDKMREKLGVDVLRLGAGNDGKSATVQAGKYVAEGLFVGAKQGTGPGSSAATVEVEITPNLSLETDVGTDSRSRVGLQWKWDY